MKITYCDGVHMYFYGRTDTNHTKTLENNLPNEEYSRWQVNYSSASVELIKTQNLIGEYYALNSYLTTIAYFYLDRSAKEIKFYDFSRGYSPTTSKQCSIFKAWLERNADGYAFKSKEFLYEETAKKRLQRGLL